jgi:hypothetical protein
MPIDAFLSYWPGGGSVRGVERVKLRAGLRCGGKVWVVKSRIQAFTILNTSSSIGIRGALSELLGKSE